MNSLKKGEGVPLLNFVGGPEVPLLNFEGGSGVTPLNFEGGPWSRVPGSTKMIDQHLIVSSPSNREIIVSINQSSYLIYSVYSFFNWAKGT